MGLLLHEMVVLGRGHALLTDARMSDARISDALLSNIQPWQTANGGGREVEVVGYRSHHTNIPPLPFPHADTRHGPMWRFPPVRFHIAATTDELGIKGWDGMARGGDPSRLSQTTWYGWAASTSGVEMMGEVLWRRDPSRTTWLGLGGMGYAAEAWLGG